MFNTKLESFNRKEAEKKFDEAVMKFYGPLVNAILSFMNAKGENGVGSPPYRLNSRLIVEKQNSSEYCLYLIKKETQKTGLFKNKTVEVERNYLIFKFLKDEESGIIIHCYDNSKSSYYETAYNEMNNQIKREREKFDEKVAEFKKLNSMLTFK